MIFYGLHHETIKPPCGIICCFFFQASNKQIQVKNILRTPRQEVFAWMSRVYSNVFFSDRKKISKNTINIAHESSPVEPRLDPTNFYPGEVDVWIN